MKACNASDRLNQRGKRHRNGRCCCPEPLLLLRASTSSKLRSRGTGIICGCNLETASISENSPPKLFHYNKKYTPYKILRVQKKNKTLLNEESAGARPAPLHCQRKTEQRSKQISHNCTFPSSAILDEHGQPRAQGPRVAGPAPGTTRHSSRLRKQARG